MRHIRRVSHSHPAPGPVQSAPTIRQGPRQRDDKRSSAGMTAGSSWPPPPQSSPRTTLWKSMPRWSCQGWPPRFCGLLSRWA